MIRTERANQFPAIPLNEAVSLRYIDKLFCEERILEGLTLHIGYNSVQVRIDHSNLKNLPNIGQEVRLTFVNKSDDPIYKAINGSVLRIQHDSSDPTVSLEFQTTNKLRAWRQIYSQTKTAYQLQVESLKEAWEEFNS